MKLAAMMIATAMLGTAMAATTAKADINWGPMKNGSQCWKYSVNGYHFEYGYWDQCPAPAAAVTPHHVRHHASHHPKRS
jgi:hypothetical protein